MKFLGQVTRPHGQASCSGHFYGVGLSPVIGEVSCTNVNHGQKIKNHNEDPKSQKRTAFLAQSPNRNTVVFEVEKAASVFVCSLVFVNNSS
jgi:hypothetical protein